MLHTCKKSGFALFFVLTCMAFMLTGPIFAVDASDEIDADWDPDMSSYKPAPNNWPLCGDILNSSTTWSEGQACTSKAADRVVSTYGPRPQSGDFDFHRGIDLRTTDMELDNDDLEDPVDPSNPCDHDCIPHTSPVFAIADGEVDEIEFKCKSGVSDGFRVVLVHEYDDGSEEYEWYTRYVHLSSVAILDSSITTPTCTGGSQSWEWEPSITVSAGQHIGYTGKSTSNNHHLHFEVRKDSSWSRHAVHPQRIMPSLPSVSSSTVEFSSFGSGQPEVEVDGGLVDIVRVELEQATCDDVAGTLVCSDFEAISDGQNADGYLEDPPFFDYERSNYQFSHRGGSVWTNTSGFAYCPHSGDHGSSYDSDLHLTEDDTYVHTFNGTRIEVFGGVTPYERLFRFDELTLPWEAGHDYTCLRPVAETAGNGTLTGDMMCRSYDGGPFETLP